MSLMAVPTTRSGDSLPAELRVRREFRGSPYFSRARLIANQAGLTGMSRSVDVGFKVRGGGMSGISGIGDVCDPNDPAYDLSACISASSPDQSGVLAPVEVPPIEYTSTQLQNLNTSIDALNAGVLPGDTATLNQISSVVPPGSVYSGPTVLGPGSSVPAAPSGYQWASLVNASGQTLAKILAVSQGGSSLQLANGSQLVYGSPAAAAASGGLVTAPGVTASLGNLTPLLLVGLGLLLFMSMGKR